MTRHRHFVSCKVQVVGFASSLVSPLLICEKFAARCPCRLYTSFRRFILLGLQWFVALNCFFEEHIEFFFIGREGAPMFQIYGNPFLVLLCRLCMCIGRPCKKPLVVFLLACFISENGGGGCALPLAVVRFSHDAQSRAHAQGKIGFAVWRVVKVAALWFSFFCNHIFNNFFWL